MPANSKSASRPAKSKWRAPEILPDWVGRYEVEIDDSQKVLKVDPRRLVDVARSVLAAEKCVSASISLAIVDNEMIHELNVRYLQHDFPTDVLSFLLEEEFDAAMLPIPKDAPRGYGKRIEGEIILSAEMAQQSAAKYRWQPLDEVTLYVVHGLLHLCGYDDMTRKQQSLMQQREREVLAIWGLSPHYAEPA
jgi:probable rRNA maturation factor